MNPELYPEFLKVLVPVRDPEFLKVPVPVRDPEFLKVPVPFDLDPDPHPCLEKSIEGVHIFLNTCNSRTTFNFVKADNSGSI